MDKKRKRDSIKAGIVQKVADMAGVKKDLVYKVLRGDRNNETVMMLYMELVEGQNKLVEAVKTLLPFERYQDIELQMRYERTNY